MRPRRRRDRRRVWAWALRVAGLLVLFAVGVAIGQALDDASPPAGTRTSVRTLTPGTLSAETITVTVTTAP
jgi:cytochrome bd-type quinol oxidase subunit 2